ncbi:MULTISPECIES: AMP-binding protein [unclassified Nocardioides]|uniref:AMP-binding protein n=1 Tax=unclassified Nocardioides TaxID=2615069 RepID=UPI0006FF4D33|nr:MULTISPECIES: AMP-binding protein [unclassified Nocardioides]KQY50083.1 fatty-acid--CoA ligase [Nocardioides sp. Root140]KQZ75707.1 fatty-acid--CoA ligase [Nocardioides sp. Root151]KRF14779.1 fatty-acid--CoA ligase [Nocardioides sp. Soil796]
MAALKNVHDRYTDEEIASYYEAGFWQRTSFNALVAQQVEERPDSTFVFDSTSSFTFREFGERALRLAAGLHRAGVRKGERVGVQLPNWTEFAVVAAALSRIGAIVVPIMPIYRDDEVGYVLQHSGAAVAITCGEVRGFNHAEMFAELAKECPDLRATYIARADADLAPALGSPLDGLVADGDLDALEAEIGPDSNPDDGFLIVYTSGTTSRPKGCFHTFNTLRASAAAIAKSLDYSADDVQFGPSPITHSTGLVTSVVLPLLAGAQSCLMEAWDPVEALRLIEQHGCTTAVTATPFLQMLMGAYDADKHDASSLRRWVCAGSPIPGSVVEKAGALFAGCQTLSLYGRSENFLTTMCTVHDPAERSATSDGSALEGAAIHVVDVAGNEVPRGDEGDIAYKGPSHMIEYFRNDEETAALFTSDGFSRSGDLGRMDADGFVRVTGRLKDIVIRGGMNISARELEDHLLAHPQIANVAVVGMPDERLGEKVCVYVVPADPDGEITLDDVVGHLKDHKVATQKLPERLEIVQAMPMTATGKIQKHVLRADIAKKLS